MSIYTLIIPLLHATHPTPVHWLEHYAEAIVLGIGIIGLLGVVVAVYWLQRTQTAQAESLADPTEYCWENSPES